MGRNNIDTIIHYDMTPEEREEELKELKDESDKLTEWEEIQQALLTKNVDGAFFMQRKENTKWQKMIFLK